jgi:acetolactate synthase-1/2/3 large subunit
VKVANPDKQVVSLNGDGGFMFGVQELATAVQHNINLVTIVFNDNAYGNVRRMQRQLYDNRIIASDLRNPDFVKLAESFGALGLRAHTADDLRRALEQGFAANAPTLIEVPVGELPSPSKFWAMPRVR